MHHRSAGSELKRRFRKIILFLQGPRKLDVLPAGRWVIGLCIVLGLVALASGNNFLYFSVALLLGAVLVSGVLSEMSLKTAELEISIRSAHAKSPTKDQILIRNTGKRHLFDIEIGEWIEDEFHSIGLVTEVAPQQQGLGISHKIYPTRGKHLPNTFAVATTYPFGWVRKIKIFDQDDTRNSARIIWPHPISTNTELDFLNQDRNEIYITDPATPDSKQIMHKLYAKTGDLVYRQQTDFNQEPEIRNTKPVIEIRLVSSSAEQFELSISQATGRLVPYLHDRNPPLIQFEGRFYENISEALDELSTKNYTSA